jgi:hypothetical protein
VSEQKQYNVESILGTGGYAHTFDFDEALDMAIECVLDYSDIIQLREEGAESPCLLIVPAKHNTVDIFELTAICLDDVKAKYA